MGHRPLSGIGPIAHPLALRRYTTLVSLVGTCCVVAVCVLVARDGVAWRHETLRFILLLTFMLIGETHTILGRHETDGANTSTPFAIAALFVFGWPEAVLMQVLACGTSGMVRRHASWRATFNTAQYAVALTAAGLIGAAGGLRTTHLAAPIPGAPTILGLIGVGGVYFAVNHLLVWQAISFWKDERLGAIVRRDLWHQLVMTGTMIIIAPLVGIITVLNPLLLPLFIPIQIAIHRSASIYREREYQSEHDPLTGLPNRALLIQRCEAALAIARRGNAKVGLALLDLDRFKEVNDTLGHLTGDELLRQVADRLAGAVRRGDTVARLGGDEFAVLLPGAPDVAAAKDLARRIGETLGEPFVLQGFTLDLEASTGVALYPDHGSDFETLLARADVAMYQAKRLRTGVATYDPMRDVNTPDRLALLHDLRRALENGDLDLHYQPKVSFGGSVVGFEALVRWNHPVRGPVSPEDFVGLAEHTGLMPRLTSYVIDRALRQLSEWWRAGMSVPVAVNMSLRDIHEPGFVSNLEQRLRAYDVPASALQLEITERVLLEDPERAIAVFSSLDELGVRLSLDDFGTGYSSLVMLRRVPVSELKIDRSFVTRLTEDGDDAVIVRSTVDLGHSLGLNVVAEGVEDAATWDRLAVLGCDVAQGWLIARALSPAAATAWLRRRMSETEAESGVPRANGAAGTVRAAISARPVTPGTLG
jgi:diguanylate cyclase (GGDEF)-like protein